MKDQKNPTPSVYEKNETFDQKNLENYELLLL